MTTIAYRNGVLAADTGMTVGNTVVGNTVKIVRRDDGCMAGAAGFAGYAGSFLRWFMAGQIGDPPEAKSEDNVLDRGVIFRPDGAMLVFEPEGMFEMTAPYYAFGCGRCEALGAMFAGADAEAAVRAAIAHDAHTSGDVTVLRA